MLELTEPPPDRGARLAADHRDHLVVAAHRDALHVDLLGGAEQRRDALHDLTAAQGLGDEGARRLVDHRADQVRRVDGLAGGRPHLGQDDGAGAVLAVDGREQEQVGEAEVGERLPRSGEALHVAERFAPQRGLGARLLEERGHTEGCSVPACAKRHSPTSASPATSVMSWSNVGTRTTTSGRRASSAWSSASRRATTS